MLTRLYIDNFRCFEKFEYRPAQRELILGQNGSGKSSLFDALLFLRQFVVEGKAFDDYVILAQRTRWLDKPEITAELEVEIEGGKYLYQLIIDAWGEPSRARAVSETVYFEGKPIFVFAGGVVQRFNDGFEQTVKYDFDWHRSALATTVPKDGNRTLSRLLLWFESVFCFRVNPFAMLDRIEGKSTFPNVWLSNMAGWYWHLQDIDPKQNEAMLASLSESLEEFRNLTFENFGGNTRLLVAEFGKDGSKKTRFAMSELSEGQRCLIALYIVLHFVVAKGGTVMFDEPDNFISLREIQPWLSAVEDAIDDGMGQVLLISHHPEIINQWAPGSGVQLVRDGSGPVSVEPFHGDPDSFLTAAELIARGWDRE